jgi:hypothetical protein
VTERIVFRPTGAARSIPFVEIGRVQAGAWGAVDDGAWLGASEEGDALELLFLTRPEYQHAVRGLSPGDIAEVISQRRSTFAPQIASVALGLVELRVRDSLGALRVSSRDSSLRADLLTALASFTTVPRFSGTAVPELLDYLREGDARIIAELQSASLRNWGDLDPGGDECSTRHRFATEIGQLAARRGRPEKARVLPYFDVERAYLLTPPSAELEAAAHSSHDPATRFGDGLIVPVAERNVAALEARGHRAAVVFPTRGQFMAASAAMTPAQFAVEVSDRLASPGFALYLRALRLQQATWRTSVRLIAGSDPDLVALLVAQLEEETTKLGTWLGYGIAPAAPGAAVDDLRSAIEMATFLVAFCRQRGTLASAGGLEALTRALSHVAESFGG